MTSLFCFPIASRLCRLNSGWHNRCRLVGWPGYDFAFESGAGHHNRICAAGAMNRFLFLQDRLFLISLATYAGNRLIIRPRLAGFFQSHLSWAWPFLHSHLDDLLLMPAALPVVLWLQRLTGLRSHDRPPGWGEMVGHLVVWSVMCKIVGPFGLHLGAPDPWDVLFFAAGGIAACLWWNRPVFQPIPTRS